jgi:hypothetical protein
MEGAIAKALMNERFQGRCFDFDSHAFTIRQWAVPGQISEEVEEPGMRCREMEPPVTQE